MKRYSLRDTAGEAWQVLPSDPAYPLVAALDKLGWAAEGEPGIILPASVLIWGWLNADVLHEAQMELDSLIDLTPDLDADLIRAHASYQQLRYLNEHPLHNG